mgnify:CR=1 FL=1
MEHLGGILGRIMSCMDRWHDLTQRAFRYDGAGAWHRGDWHVTETAMFRMSPAQWQHWLETLD